MPVTLSVTLVAELGLIAGTAGHAAQQENRPIPPIVSPETVRKPQPATENFRPLGSDKVVIPNKELSNLSPEATPNGKVEASPGPPKPPAKSEASQKAPKGYVEGTSKELDRERKGSAKIFANPDGTKTARVYGSPVHFQGPDGQWKDIDTKVVADGAGFKNAAGPFEARFARTADSPELAVVAGSGTSIAFSMEGASNSAGSASGEEVKYKEVQPGVDLQYLVAKTLVKETVLLKRPPKEQSPTTFRFPLKLSGLVPRQEQDGSIGFYDSKGDLSGKMPAATMWDSKVGEDSAEPAYGPARLELLQEPQGWVIALHADVAWLSSPERKYPVYLDPSYAHFGGGRAGGALDAYVTDMYPNTNFNVDYNSALGRFQDKIGHYNDGVTGLNWTYIFYDLTFLNNKTILQADWNGYFIWSYYPSTWTPYRVWPASSHWVTDQITWNNKPGTLGDTRQADAVRNNWSGVNITPWVHNWTHGVWQNHGIMIENPDIRPDWWKKLAANENSDGSQSFIEIDFNTPPAPDTPVSPANGATFHNLSPLLDVNGFDGDGDALQHYFRLCEGADAETNCVWESGWVPTDQVTVPAGELEWNKTYYWHTYSYDGFDVGYPNWVRSFRPVNSPPTQASLSSPPDGAVLTTLTPSISLNPSSDPDADAVQYYIRVSEAADGLSGGAVNDSGWLTGGNRTWNVPAGALADGKKYYWTALATDPFGAYTTGWSAPRSFRVDLGLGEKESRPYDSLGALSVNLGNGNLLASTSSPSVNALGGPIGISYNYNSQAPAATGLKGEYFRHDEKHDFTGEKVLTRLDSPVNFNWSNSAPYPSMHPDDFTVRWTGYVTAPVAGTYQFGRISDDGVRIWINNSLVVDSWVDQGPSSAPIYGTGVTLSAGQTVPVKIEYFEHFVSATMQFWVKGPAGAVADPGGSVVPGTWLSSDLPGLPGGWAMSADPDGELSYTFAKMSDQQVVLTDSSGATHTYRSTGSGWEPPEDEEGILANDPDTGRLVLQAEDGLVYNFASDGTLASVVSALDDRKPAALQYAWTGTPPRLTKITDPVSERAVTLTYHVPGATNCPSLAGFNTPPSYMLCKLDYSQFGAGESLLYYSGGQLARIVDPGNEVTDFGYSASGKLTQIKDSLTNDLIASGQITEATSANHKTVVTYDAAGKATKVTAPVADSSAAPRPEHSYIYQPPVTKVSVAGTAPSVGYARQVSVDAGGRTTEDRDSAGKLTSYVWDQDDRLISTTDPAGLKSTTLYDAAGRPTDEYGPAQPSEFGADRRSATAPHSVTAYDEGIDGLGAAWWENGSMAGPPKAHTTFGAWQDWGTGSPTATVPVDGFSGRLTGEINAPSAGNYNFAADVGGDDGVKLYVDDKAVIDRWQTYRSGIIKDAPMAYWRLGESSGTTAADSSGNARNASYVSGVGLGAPGSVEGDADTGATFDGINDYVISPALSPGSESLTFELWFKPEAAGVILSELGQATPNTAWHDSQLEILPSGEVRASVWMLPPVTLGTAAFGSWQHVALRYDKTSQALDGFLNGVRSSTYSSGDRMSPWESGYTLHYALGAADSSHRGSGGGWFKGAIDEAAFYNKPLSDARIQTHYKASKLQGSATLTAGAHRVRVDYQDPSGAAKLALNWTPPGGPAGTLPVTSLKPRYGLVTSEIDPDGKKVLNQYQTPELGLETASVVDPAGLNLRSTTTYEPAGSGYFRATARTLPKGNATEVTYAHFAAKEAADNPCTDEMESIDQGGMVKKDTSADPDGTGPKDPIVRQYRYDAQGRRVAEQVLGDSTWSCTTYDSRGRVKSQKDSSGKTTSMDYSVPDKVTTSFKDSSGASQTTVSKTDWMGRELSYTDEHNTTTRSVYDQAGRVTATYRSLFGAAESQLTASAYDAATTRLSSLTEFLSGSPRVTSFTYDEAGRLKTTARPNGVVTTDTYDQNRGWLANLSHKKDSTELSPWTYTRSPSGDITSEQTTGRSRNFTYDAAGRLTKTTEGAVTRNYSYDQNTNRCSTTVSCDGSYQYDNADRIVSSPFASSYSYDSHGNVTSANLTKGPSQFTTQLPGQIAAEKTVAEPIAASAAGTITAALDWQPTTSRNEKTDMVGDLGAKDYMLKVSPSGPITATLTWPEQTLNPNLDLTLFDPSGAEVASSMQLTGNSESINFEVTGVEAHPDSKTYNLKVKALGMGSDFTLKYDYPATADLDLQLVDSSGVKVAEAASTSAKPETLAFDVPSGASAGHSLKVVSKDHGASYSLGVGYPRSSELKIAYDPNDHAIQTDDGTSVVKETLSPTGRVLRRLVTDPTGKVIEDMLYGYDDGEDSPAYERPTSGGPITTYLAGPEGVLAIDKAGAATYPLANSHGDIVGNSDSNGAFSSTPATDEFGIGGVVDSRLRWLGTKQRYSTGASLNLIRMGVRLYDPALGRFLQVDPIEGGSANDYDYVSQDPVNNTDLDGKACWKCRAKKAKRFARRHRGALFLAASIIIPGGAFVRAGITAYSIYRTVRGRGSFLSKVAGVGVSLVGFGVGRYLSAIGKRYDFPRFQRRFISKAFTAAFGVTGMATSRAYPDPRRRRR